MIVILRVAIALLFAAAMPHRAALSDDTLPTRAAIGDRHYEGRWVMIVDGTFEGEWPFTDALVNLVCIPELKSGGGFVVVPLDKRVYSVSGWSRVVSEGKSFALTQPRVTERSVVHLFDGPHWNGMPIWDVMARLAKMGCDGTPPLDKRHRLAR